MKDNEVEKILGPLPTWRFTNLVVL